MPHFRVSLTVIASIAALGAALNIGQSGAFGATVQKISQLIAGGFDKHA